MVGDYFLSIGEEDNRISNISISEHEIMTPIDSFIEETPLIRKAYNELHEYFQGKRKEFTVPLLIRGTIFQKKVFEALLTIEYGKTVSYKDIAQQVDSPHGYRAVGNAVNKNPIGIIVPCHRVIGSDGSLVGFASGLKIKQFLLDIEKTHF